MKRTHLLAYVVAGAVVFAAGYAFGSGDPIGSLRKQPASMLTVGVLGANEALSDGFVAVEGNRLVVSKSVMKGGQCQTELATFRQTLGVRYDKNGVKTQRSTMSRYFLPAEEQNSNDSGVLARRDAIDEATIVRIQMSAGSCEGPLLTPP